MLVWVTWKNVHAKKLKQQLFADLGLPLWCSSLLPPLPFSLTDDDDGFGEEDEEYDDDDDDNSSVASTETAMEAAIVEEEGDEEETTTMMAEEKEKKKKLRFPRKKKKKKKNKESKTLAKMASTGVALGLVTMATPPQGSSPAVVQNAGERTANRLNSPVCHYLQKETKYKQGW